MRRKRPLTRTEGTLRSANLVVIASEDTHAVQQYFDFFHSTRIQFKVLATEDGNSSPQDVLARLLEFKKEFDLQDDGDQLWLVTDSDHWIEAGHIANLTRVIKQCRQNNIQVAMSCPCFDLWLLLHFEEAPTSLELTCSDVGTLIREAVGSYNKTKVYKLPIDMPKVSLAIERAKAVNPNGPILTIMGTEVFRIVEDLVRLKIVDIRT